jgi:hypothetical protein
MSQVPLSLAPFHESAVRATAHDERVRLQRRAFLRHTCTGLLGSIALAWLNAPRQHGQVQGAEPNRASGPHFWPRAERIICLFQNGGPSQMDLFDPKPELAKRSGQPYPGKQKVETLSPSASGNLLGSPFAFRPAGECGMLLSELIPHTAAIADDLAGRGPPRAARAGAALERRARSPVSGEFGSGGPAA